MNNPQHVTDARSPQHTGARRAIPKAINWATTGYSAHVVLSLLVLLLFIINRSEVADTVRRMNPGLSQNQIEAQVNSIQLLVNGSHVFFGVLSACFALLIRQGKNWVRGASTVAFVLAVLETLYAWSSPTNVPAILSSASRPYIIVVQIILLLILAACVALQWFPRSSRDFFAAEKRSNEEMMTNH